MSCGLLLQVDPHVVAGRQQQRDDDDRLTFRQCVEGCRHIRLLHVHVSEPDDDLRQAVGDGVDQPLDCRLPRQGRGAVRDCEERGSRHPPIVPNPDAPRAPRSAVSRRCADRLRRSGGGLRDAERWRKCAVHTDETAGCEPDDRVEHRVSGEDARVPEAVVETSRARSRCAWKS